MGRLQSRSSSGSLAARMLASWSGFCLWTAAALRQRTLNEPSTQTGSHLGNAIAGISFYLLKAEQCGQCGPQRVFLPAELPREPWVAPFRALFGLPFSADASDATCEPNIDCSRVTDPSFAEANFPPWDATKELFKRRLWPAFRLKDQLERRRAEVGREDIVVAHLRGGDILPRGDNLDYMPAPCKFIDHIARTGNAGGPFRAVVLLSDSEDHPCIAYVRARHANVSFAMHSEVEDLITIMSARNVALSTSSTFGFTGMLMNPHRDVNVFLPTYSGKPLCCEGNYNDIRLRQLCNIGRGSAVYEFRAPALGRVPSRRDWILDDAHFNGTSIHTCS